MTQYVQKGSTWGAADIARACVCEYTHTYDTATKTHNFACAQPGPSGRALITAGYTLGDAFTVNGEAVSAYTAGYETDELTVGRWVQFVYDAQGAQINFNGGDTAFNFRIAAVADENAPELSEYTAKENVLAVVTTQPIQGYSLSADAPDNAHEGMVWIATAAASTLTFNALRRQRLDVSPLTAKQYENGAWADRMLLMYKGGVWTPSTFVVRYLPGAYGGFSAQAYPRVLNGAATPAFEGMPTSSNSDYAFNGWSPAVASQVTKSQDYVAQWKRVKMNLYARGNHCVADTGDWNGAISYNFYGTACSCSQFPMDYADDGTGIICFGGSNNHWNNQVYYRCTGKAVDFTNMNTLKVYWRVVAQSNALSTGSLQLIITKNPGVVWTDTVTNWAAGLTFAIDSGQGGVLAQSINVASLTGGYYIIAATRGVSSCWMMLRVFDMWLEV